jgi:hypothetical protein
MSLWPKLLEKLSSSQFDPAKQDGYKILLTGSSKSFKSSILFNLAYNLADLGETVLYIGIKAKIEANLPLYVDSSSHRSVYGMSDHHGFHPSILSRVHMVYVSNLSELIGVVMKLQLYEMNSSPISCVLIDDIDDLVSDHSSASTRPNLAVKNRLLLLALLDEAWKSLNTKLIQLSRPRCILIMVDNADERQLSTIYPRLVNISITTRKQYSENYDVEYFIQPTTAAPVQPLSLFHASLSGDRIILS